MTLARSGQHDPLAARLSRVSYVAERLNELSRKLDAGEITTEQFVDAVAELNKLKAHQEVE